MMSRCKQGSCEGVYKNTPATELNSYVEAADSIYAWQRLNHDPACSRIQPRDEHDNMTIAEVYARADCRQLSGSGGYTCRQRCSSASTGRMVRWATQTGRLSQRIENTVVNF
eukprot:jgi/Ulvmu1/8687/UM047_0027.1